MTILNNTELQLRRILGLLILFSFFQLKITAQSKKMNIIFILADDLGWMDTGAYGSKYYETPNIDAFAKKGMLFTNAYSANPLCSPSRAAVLTGRYPSRYDFTTASGHNKANPEMVSGLRTKAAAWQKVRTPEIRNYMPLEEQTIAEVLKEEGYKTIHIGKWHIGNNDYFPKKQGFDVNIGGYALGWPRSYFSPYKNEKITDGPDGEYITDRITTDAIDFIKKNKKQPFFMNLWHFAVHGPYEAKKELVAKYENKVDPRGRQGFPVMGAMIESFDENVGRLLNALEEENMMDNTVIVFTSDNGGVEYTTYNGMTPTDNYPLREGKANVHEGGIRVPCIVYWPGKTKPGTVSNQAISGVDFFPTFVDMLDVKGNKVENEIDGLSLRTVFESDKPLEREGVYIDFPHYTVGPANYPSTVLVNGDWKFIKVYGEGPDTSDFYELYQIRTDIKEEFNLAAYYPKVIEEFNAQMTKHIDRMGTYTPEKNSSFVKEAENPMGAALKAIKKEKIIIKPGIISYSSKAKEAVKVIPKTNNTKESRENFGPYNSDCVLNFDIQPSAFFSGLFVRPSLEKKEYFARFKFGAAGQVILFDGDHRKEGSIASNFKYKLNTAYNFRISLSFSPKKPNELTVEAREVGSEDWIVLFKDFKQSYNYKNIALGALDIKVPEKLNLRNFSS